MTHQTARANQSLDSQTDQLFTALVRDEVVFNPQSGRGAIVRGLHVPTWGGWRTRHGDERMVHDVVDGSFIDPVQSTLEGLKRYNVSRFVLSPTRWGLYDSAIPLSWNAVKFDKSEKENLPTGKQGVYTFIVKPGIANHPACAYLLYVGKTEKQGFRTRFLDYFREPDRPKARQAVKAMIGLWGNHLWFCYAPVDDIAQIDALERKLIDSYVPPINQEYPGVLGKAVKAWQ